MSNSELVLYQAPNVVAKHMCVSIDDCIGETISSVIAGGVCRNLTRKAIEAYVYHQRKDLHESERKAAACYSRIPPDLLFPRTLELEGPLWIFCKHWLEVKSVPGNGLSVQCPDISWWPSLNTNIEGPEALPGAGETISDIRVTKSGTIITTVDVHLGNGKTIHVVGKEPLIEVTYLSKTREMEFVPFHMLKKGLYNWEDLHCDDEIGFSAKSPLVFVRANFGDSIDFSSLDAHEHRIQIQEDDGEWIECGIAIVRKGWIDHYGDETFSWNEWNEILAVAARLLSFHRFDDLFDYLIGLGLVDEDGCNIFLNWLNHCGADFWKKREQYSLMYEDVKRWSSLALDHCQGVSFSGP